MSKLSLENCAFNKSWKTNKQKKTVGLQFQRMTYEIVKEPKNHM